MVASSVLVPASAHGATIEQTKAEIAALSSRLARLSKTSEITANAYDTAKVQLEGLNTNIVQLQGQEAAKRAAIILTSKELVTSVVKAYVLGAADAQILALFNQSATTSDARKIYERQVIGDLDKLKSTYEFQKRSLEHTITLVGVQRAKAREQTQAMANLLAENIHNTETTRATLAVLTKSLKSEIIAYEIQAGVAAARNRDTAGEQQAVAAAATIGGVTAANAVTEAIQAAIARPRARGPALRRGPDRRALRLGWRDLGQGLRLLGPRAVGLGQGRHPDPAHDPDPVAGDGPRAAHRTATGRPALLLQPRRRPPGRPRRHVRRQRTLGGQHHHRGALHRHDRELRAALHRGTDRRRAAVALLRPSPTDLLRSPRRRHELLAHSADVDSHCCRDPR
jgi:hypothetical protein